MATAKNEDFGWELLFTASKSQITTKQDAIVCFVHWVLVSRNFRCVGVGDNVTEFNEADKSELLPIGWNETSRINLRYVHDKTVYVLISIVDENNLVVNINRHLDQRTSGVNISLDEVMNITGSANAVFKSQEELATRIKQQLIDPILEFSSPSSVATQTSSTDLSTRLTGESYIPPTPPLNMRYPGVPPYLDNPVANVGRADLYPFGRGGGMLMDPPNVGLGRRPGAIDSHTGLPYGAVPPGARFDPFRPPGVMPRPPRGPRNPDYDHLPPPGFDDMFM